ncbi:T9SS type B sorting domain-containing protein [Subsaxibacter sp. CAU 1640]|uniref:T9SS type B sorting domain-containing protein n=1 Tax=Subsaxibacter sp. CAU 1640 TaxID=2933271 RepID=UPI00200556CA|nr:T9SS type B sorting domain-containing protein [Subsaxibacter sp. CAU 1640]MCK7591574.1 T9SS type B sorting domain-containing protein [Subsaxibacter sp. CAU 1640]
MKKIFTFLLLVSSFYALSQNQAANWYFGYGAALQFDLGANTLTSINGGALSTNEGCASISDVFGNLLFYTDGSFVWNRNNNIMTNGSGLFGDPSSTQSAIIVPKPNDPDIYYVFTVDNALNGSNFGLNYSIIDMTLSGGLGSVTNKNINLLDNCSEKISAVLKDCITKSIWVLTYASQNGSTTNYNSFYAYEVSDTGVNPVPVVTTFNNMTTQEARGYLKLSPDGEKLACANMGSGMFLFDFDANTGIVSSQQQLTINTASNSAYGVEFSPNSQFLYVNSSNDQQSGSPAAHASTLSQFDLTAPNISASRITIDQQQLYRGGLQLGPDGRIYRALSATYDIGLPSLGVINNPNEPGLACDYQHNAVNLSPNNSSQGLPPFIQSIFNTQIDIIRNNVNTVNLPLCEGESYTLMADDILGADYTWTLDGNPLPETDFDLVITQSGHYQVYIDQNNGDCDIEGQAFVSYYQIPVANQPSNIVNCDTTTTSTFDLTLQNSNILGPQDLTNYEVHYYRTQQDALDDMNEINGTFTNDSNPQEIFARIHHRNNSNCFDTTSFFIEVNITPIVSNIDDVTVCDTDFNGNFNDGFTTLNLSDYTEGVLGNQDDALYTVTYHNSQLDADSGDNPLPSSYTNQMPYVEEIFVRVENNSNTDCYSTDSFILTVNDSPEAFDTTVVQCDEDGIPEGYTVFNINQALDDITGGTANREVTYYLSMTDALAGENEINGDAFENFFNPQVVYAKVTDTTSGCSNFADITLTVSNTFAYNATLERCDDDGTEDGFYNFDLTDANDTVMVTLPSNLNISYYENYVDALLETNALGTSYTNTTPYSQTIYARVENGNACYGISEVKLTVFELPNIEIEDEVIYCLNTFPETTIITGGVVGDSASNYYYLWSTGENTSEIMVNEPGVYTVRVTNTDGCYKDRTVTVLPSNIATITNVEIVDATQNNTVTILVSGEGDYEYALDDMNGPYQDSNRFDNVPPGFHTVYVKDQNDCGIAEELISVIGFPKFFTPNDDTYNDFWQVYGVNTQFQPNTMIYIFDRHGKLIKELDPLSKGWDGTLNGYNLPASDYWFQVTLQDGRVYNGHFALKR